MAKRSDIRRLAMQVLYQLDQRGDSDHRDIRDSLVDGFDDATVQEPAFKLAMDAWTARNAGDLLVAHLAPDWPTHRQPPVDRAILRLAIHEIKSGYSPANVAINEAVNLAKEYGSENSPSFINGVLDKVAKRSAATTTQPKAAAGDPWLSDALTTPDAASSTPASEAADVEDDIDDEIDLDKE